MSQSFRQAKRLSAHSRRRVSLFSNSIQDLDDHNGEANILESVGLVYGKLVKTKAGSRRSGTIEIRLDLHRECVEISQVERTLMKRRTEIDTPYSALAAAGYG